MSGTIRTNIVLDQTLVEEALSLSGLSSRRELVDFALRELVRRARHKELLALKGKINWEDDLSDMRETR